MQTKAPNVKGVCAVTTPESATETSRSCEYTNEKQVCLAQGNRAPWQGK